MTNTSDLSALEVVKSGPVVPVLVIERVEDAVPLAHALLEGGIKVLEVTLRTEQAIAAIRVIAQEVPEAIVGAGTISTQTQLEQVEQAGGKFAISPGGTPKLLELGKQSSVPLIPGISTVSELMIAMEYGYEVFKFFPAEAVGGVKALKSIAGPFPNAVFCPTGGISLQNYTSYLSLPNVSCVGGSWLAPADKMQKGQWSEITQLAKEAVAGAA